MNTPRPATPAGILRAAKAKIAHSQDWIRGYLALNEEGRTVDPNNPTACKFCMMGALYNVAEPQPSANQMTIADAAFAALYDVTGGTSTFNDHPATTHAEVLDAFDRAIAKVQQT